MKQVPIKLGPLALLLTVISICLTILAILTFLRLAERYAATVYERYQLETAGQELLAELRESDPGMLDMERDADGVWWTDLEKNGAHLHIGVKKGADGWEPVAWRMDKDWEEDTDLNVWDGGFRFGD